MENFGKHVLFFSFIVAAALLPFLLVRLNNKVESTTKATKLKSELKVDQDLTNFNDGICDDDLNNDQFSFDNGDCCEDNTASRVACQICLCNVTIMEKLRHNAGLNCSYQENKYYTKPHPLFNQTLAPNNGVCQPVLNTFEYFFDGGDCCLNETEASRHCFKGVVFCIESEIGDGICQDYNAGVVCGYDGGDCCGLGTFDQCCYCECGAGNTVYDYQVTESLGLQF